MKKQFLPYGYQEQTDQQISEMEAKFKKYEYYGIPYGVFDEDESTQVEKDRSEAILLIAQGLPIPKDLEDRLLSYKEQEKKHLTLA